ncbi:serine/threonine protein kinase [Corallococcus macrosporus]|uniref:Serine/threonine protein kinase n=1 Tax=Myxococcus fulvus (strain ATCC BAA-855 / HW-1) TaxID=483219 RepID=F8C750_MYXFH|nr:serine/threonine-protein kinase [Corallococcus macrosporus]AEI68171.1 serine/threonine protein kinase [Corallococcus macrosporus]
MKKPTLFGKYLLLERINVGGMAEVFIAKAFGVEGFERILAIKKILPTMAEDEEFITMFIDEARISVQLNHANIVHINELGKHDDTYFIAMEYVAGRDVRTMLERYRRRKEIMPTAQAVFIASKICDGLDYAHRKKDARGQDLHIIHRDVSPQNVLISYEGEVKVIDFGIAKAANRSQKTQAGILKGKFGYMSPEQVRGMPIDRRSDIFAVGVLLYEMLTGEKLFVGESDFSTLEKVRNAEVPLPSEFNPSIPQGLEKVVLKALTREPEDRYQWASDMAEDLMRFLLAGDAIYSSKHLSGYMKEAFAEDMLREAEKMERYAGIERPDQIEASGITVAPGFNRQAARRAPPPPVVVSGTPAGRASTSPAQPVQDYIPPPTAEELEEMGVGAGDKTQIVDSTQTFMSPETRVAESSVLVDDSITGRTENPIQDGGTAGAYKSSRAPAPDTSSRKGKSGPKAQVIISNEEGEAYAGATMIGPAPSAPPSRSRGSSPSLDEETGSRPAPSRARNAKRAPEPEEEPSDYEQPPEEDSGAAYDEHDDYGEEAPPHDDLNEPEEEVTGSVPVPAEEAPPPAKAAKPVKAKTKVPSKGKPALNLKTLPKPVLFAAAAAIVLVLVIGVVMLTRPSTGEVTFMVSPSNPAARIQLDGKDVQLNTLLALPAGQYRVTASAPGQQGTARTVEVVAGSRIVVSLPLESDPQAAPPAENKPPESPPTNSGVVIAAGSTDPSAPSEDPAGDGTATPSADDQTAPPAQVAAVFEGDDGAEIAVNGERLGKVPDARMANLEVGKTYSFTAKLAGYKPYSGEFKADGSTPQLTVAFEMTKEPEPVVNVRPPPQAAPKPPPAPRAPRAPRAPKVMGKFACSTKPAGADIYVDGKKTNRQTPVTLGSPLMLPVGKRKISFKLNGKSTKPVVVDITENNIAKLVNVPIE